MTTPIKHMLIPVLFVGFLFTGMITTLLTPDQAYSDAERRRLRQRPIPDQSDIFDGDYYQKLEQYSLDQFTYRERFRMINALTRTRLFNQQDINGIYRHGDHLIKMDYRLNPAALRYAGNLFSTIIETHLEGMAIHYGVIPDKNHFTAPQSHHLQYDYPRLISLLHANITGATYIDVFETLSLDDYYRTDHHLRQEAHVDLSRHLFDHLGIKAPGVPHTVYHTHAGFAGSYYGQAALPLEKDTIRLLMNPTIAALEAFELQNENRLPVYDLDGLESIDPYNVFLGGQMALRRIENPTSTTDKELIVFGDSYMTALAPLLAEGYASVTLIDLRFVSHTVLDTYIDFNDQDVLFLYSTTILNDAFMLS